MSNYLTTSILTDSGGSSLASSPYSWTSSTSGFSTTATKTVSANGTYTAYIKDSADNVGSCSVTVSYIDTAGPTGTVTMAYDDAFTVTVSDLADALSGSPSVVGYLITTSTSCPTSGYTSSTATSYTFTGTYTLGTKYYACVKIKDAANNYSYLISSGLEYSDISVGLLVDYDGLDNTGSGFSSSASTWTNLASSNYHGTLDGGVYWSTAGGIWDGGYNVDASGGIMVNNSTNLVTGSFTLQSYVYLSQYDDQYYDRDFIANWDYGGFGLYMTSNYYLSLGMDTNASSGTSNYSYSYVTSTSKLSAGNYYMVTGTYNASTGNACVYINDGAGVCKVLTTTPDLTPENSTLIAIGCDPRGSSCQTGNSGANFYGYIRSVRIYNRALTADEIEYNYNLDSDKY